MKHSPQTSALVSLLLTAFFIGAASPVRAQDQAIPDNLVQVTTVPATGTFWSMQLTNFPPLPFDPLPQLPLYTADGQSYFYDDRNVLYPPDWSPFPAAAATASTGVIQSDDVPAPPGGTNGGGGSGGGPMFVTFNPPGGGYTNCETYTNFWLKISQASDTIQIVISNTLPGMSYLLLEKTNLLNPYWTAVQELTATGSTTTATNISAGTNATLFFTAMLTTNDQPPVITQEPSNQVVALNGNAVFQVAATGLAPLAYQWQFDGTNLSGATASKLTLSGVTTNKLGTYTVIVSNAICSASAAAGLGLSWTTYLTNPINASPAIGNDGTVYISTTSSQFLALDPVLGKIKWCVPLVTGQPYELTSSAAVAANGRAVFVGSQDSSGGFLYAFNPTNGAVLWRTNLGAPIFSSPAVSPADGTIFVCTYNPGSSALFAVTPTGSVNWQFQPDDPSSTSSAMDSSPA
ncbi:MAG: PQQ-binding-like beta-propeller repeat protein, partial [Verrucomicrobiota bacterium]